MAAGCTLKGNGSDIDLSTMVLLCLFPVYGRNHKHEEKNNKIKKMMTAGLCALTMILDCGGAQNRQL